MRKGLAIIFSLLAFNLLFFPFLRGQLGNLTLPSMGTVGFFTFMASFFVFQYLAFYNSKDTRKNISTHTLTLVSLGLSGLALFRTSFVDIFVMNFVSFVASVMSLYIFSLPKGETIDSILEIVISPIPLFFESFGSIFRAKKELQLPKVKFGSEVIYLLGGIVIGLPVIALITALLASGDPVFAKFVKDLFNIKDFPWWIFSRAFYTVLWIIPTLGLSFLVIKKWQHSRIEPRQGGKFPLIALSVVGMVLVVLTTYLVVEYPYLFTKVAETELHKFNINTYSEYVTRGFMELLVVSIIVYLTSFVALGFYKLGGKGGRSLLFLNSALLVEVMIFISSIFRRVYMYQLTHGLTRVRIYGSVFLAVLLVLSLFLILRHSKKTIKWFWYELSILVVACLAIFVIRPDYIIANKFKPTVNKEVDYVHIVRLSPEAVDGWLEGYKHAKGQADELLKTDSVWDNGKLNEERNRDAYYTFLTLNILRQNYKELTLKYGTAEDLWAAKATYGGSWNSPPDVKKVNFAEREAYLKLKKEINLKELIDYEERMYKYLYQPEVGGRPFYPPTHGSSAKFDRSLNSPLMEDVKVVR